MMPRFSTLAGLMLAGACTSHRTEGMGGADPGEPVASVTQVSGSTGSAPSTTGSGSCPPAPVPPGVPDGWVEYTDWSCDCRLYVPGSKEAMPPPFEWEPCPEAPNGIVCKMVAQSWLGEDHYVGVDSYRGRLGRDATGTPLLFVYRGVLSQHGVHVVSEIDGPIRAAVYQPYFGQVWGELGCQVYNQDACDGRWILGVEGDYAAMPRISDDFGALGGAFDELPKVLLHEQPSSASDWFCGESMVFRARVSNFEVTAHPWDMSSETLVHTPAIDPEGLHVGQPHAFGGALFFSTSTLKRSGISVWTMSEGFQSFRRWIEDFTRGAGNLGTDGIDLVWSEGEGKEPNDNVYPVRSIMTAPFTTYSNALRPRRLRSQASIGIATREMKVGCGHAVHDGGSGDVMVVRLTDGWAWNIPNTATQKWSVPVGVTCEEVFVVGQIGTEISGITMARIRLDSLGPGVPPD